MPTISTTRQTLSRRSLILAIALAGGFGMLANPTEAEAGKKKYHVVFVKHPEKQEVWFTHRYTSKKQADAKAADLNKEHWIKVTPIVGRPFYRDAKKKFVAVQISAIPDKILANLTGVHVGKVEVIEKEATVRIRYYD